MKDEICDECGRHCENVWLSLFAGKQEVPSDWYVCEYCIVEEQNQIDNLK